MNIDILRRIPSIPEFFKFAPDGEIPEGTKILLESMTERFYTKGADIVVFGKPCDDGMYIITEGETEVLDANGNRINMLSVGDFIGELGLINDDKRGATVRAVTNVTCANISKALFEEIASNNRKIYGSFMNMLYAKTTKLVTEQERMKSELAIATQIQTGSLENDFSEFNCLRNVTLSASMRPAKEVGGDFYDVFMIDETHLCFLIADVSGKGIGAALFMSMAKIYLKTYATLGLPLGQVAEKTNQSLCYKNDAEMFVTAFVCVLDLEADELTFVNAGHNRPYVMTIEKEFSMVKAKANLPFGMMEESIYQEQKLTLQQGDCMLLYTDGVTEALNSAQEFFGNERLLKVININKDMAYKVELFMNAIYGAVDEFSQGQIQADDITMVYLSRM